MAKYALLFIGNEDAARALAKEDWDRIYASAGQWFRANAAVIRGGEELRPAATARTVRKKDHRPDGAALVTDGPFIEAKDQIGGFAIVEVADMSAAVELAKTWPTGGTVEVREVVTH